MNWKQPIPTGLEAVFGDDYACMALYKELIYRAANTDGHFTDKRGKTTDVKRGQVVFGRNQFREYLFWSSAVTVQRKLEKLEKTYKLVSKQSDTNFTLVELFNYDELVSFEQADAQAVSKQRASSVQAVSTSKSVKSVKTIESEKNITAVAVTPVSAGYAKWEEEFRQAMGFRITKEPKKNEAACKACVADFGADAVHRVMAYLAWLKREKKARERPHWFQYVTSYLKIRQFWDSIQASMTSDTWEEAPRRAEAAQFFNR